MSVVGFDFGNYTCYVAIARAGGIDVVANEFSYRHTSSLVAFGQKKRFLGENAKTQQTQNLKNTISNVKRLLGRKWSDPQVQEELKYATYAAKELPDGEIGIECEYQGEPATFTPIQVTAMLFTQLKSTAEQNLGTKVHDCVISVPNFWGNAQRRALIGAAHVAGLNPLRISPDTTAAALQYGIYKQDLPEEAEKPRNVVIVNFGESNMQVCAVAYNKGKLVVKAITWDNQVGGRLFDRKLVELFAARFKEKYKVDAFTNKKALLRLFQACERLKKLMSANTSAVPINIESFMDDKDVSDKYSRPEFEELCADIFARVAAPLRQVMADAGLAAGDIHSVEIIGGASRIPKLKETIAEVFGQEPTTTMNADEAVSRGCAWQCAMVSPVFRVREFSVTDVTPYAIELTWPSALSEGETSVSEVFCANNTVPSTKMLSYLRSEPFELCARYQQPERVVGGCVELGRYRVDGITRDAAGEPSKIKVKVRLNNDGILVVDGAHMVVTVEAAAAAAAAAAAPAANGDAAAADAMDTDAAANGEKDEPMADAKAADDKKAEGDKKDGAPKKKTQKVALKVVTVAEVGPQRADLEKLYEQENGMTASDKLAFETENARNAVEEYVYEMRDKIIDSLAEYIDEASKDKFSALLSTTEDWLYDEGEDAQKSVYVEKLKELKAFGDPVVTRYQEAQTRGEAEERLRTEIVLFRKAVDLHGEGHELYNHIPAGEMDKVKAEVALKESWLNDKMAAQAKLAKHDSLAVWTAEIATETNALIRTCKPVLDTPKPKVEPPKPEETPAATGEGEGAEKMEEDKPAAAAAEDDAAAAAAPAAGEGAGEEAGAGAPAPDMDLD